MNALVVGTELPALKIDPISRTTLALFAGASGDTNPVHLDHEIAQAAGMPDVFAQGMLSMAYLGRLLTDLFPADKLRSYGVRFAAITPVKGEPTCTATVTAIDESGGERRATLALTVTLADGTVTLTGDAVVALSPQPHRPDLGELAWESSKGASPWSPDPAAASAARSR